MSLFSEYYAFYGNMEETDGAWQIARRLKFVLLAKL